MTKSTRRLLAIAIAVAIAIIVWNGGHWLWHQLLVMHGLAK